MTAGIAFMGKAWDSQKTRANFVDFLASRLAECLRLAKPGSRMLCWAIPRTSHWTGTAIEDAGWIIEDRISHLFGSGFPKAKSKLKPACEDWWLARKPSKNVPPLNIDACRVGWAYDSERAEVNQKSGPNSRFSNTVEISLALGAKRSHAVEDKTHALGRYPANVIHDGSDEVVAGFPMTTSGSIALHHRRTTSKTKNAFGERNAPPEQTFGDTGSAARFFYCAKASRAERGDGNTHPTVKPHALMRYLCRLITPPNGLILDPFMGSGSTGKAAFAEGFRFIGIESDPGYFEIARKRLASAQRPLIAV